MLFILNHLKTIKIIALQVLVHFFRDRTGRRNKARLLVVRVGGLLPLSASRGCGGSIYMKYIAISYVTIYRSVGDVNKPSTAVVCASRGCKETQMGYMLHKLYVLTDCLRVCLLIASCAMLRI